MLTTFIGSGTSRSASASIDAIIVDKSIGAIRFSDTTLSKYGFSAGHTKLSLSFNEEGKLTFVKDAPKGMIISETFKGIKNKVMANAIANYVGSENENSVFCITLDEPVTDTFEKRSEKFQEKISKKTGKLIKVRSNEVEEVEIQTFEISGKLLNADESELFNKKYGERAFEFENEDDEENENN
jgi:hypothetical protein